MRWKGFEPSRYCYRQPLKLVRLPVPPPPQKNFCITECIAARSGRLRGQPVVLLLIVPQTAAKSIKTLSENSPRHERRTFASNYGFLSGAAGADVVGAGAAGAGVPGVAAGAGVVAGGVAFFAGLLAS